MLLQLFLSWSALSVGCSCVWLLTLTQRIVGGKKRVPIADIVVVVVVVLAASRRSCVTSTEHTTRTCARRYIVVNCRVLLSVAAGTKRQGWARPQGRSPSRGTPDFGGMDHGHDPRPLHRLCRWA